MLPFSVTTLEVYQRQPSAIIVLAERGLDTAISLETDRMDSAASHVIAGTREVVALGQDHEFEIGLAALIRGLAPGTPTPHPWSAAQAAGMPVASDPSHQPSAAAPVQAARTPAALASEAA